MDVHARPVIRPSSSDLWFFAYLPLAVADGISTPLIPLLALQEYGASAFVVTIIIAASAMSQVPLTILWGNLSDRVSHRKYFLVGSFLATGLSLVFMAFSSNILTFFWWNVVEGFALAASAPIGTMLLLETRQKRWWPADIGTFGLVFGIGATVGLAIGFVWLFVIGHPESMISVMTALLVVAGVLALLAAGLAWRWIEEPTVRIERRSAADLLNLHRGVLERIRQFRTRMVNVLELTRAKAERLPGREWMFLAALFVVSVGFDMFYGPFPVFLVQNAQFSDASVYIVFLAASAASTALFFHSGKAVENHSPKNVFLGTLFGRLLLMLLFIWAPVYVYFGLGSPELVGWITLLNALMGVTWAFISTASTLFLIRLVGRSARGRALGLYNALAGAGGLLGTLLGGALFSLYGVDAAYLAAACVVGVGTMILVPIPYHTFALPRTFPRRHHLGQTRATTPGPTFRRSR